MNRVLDVAIIGGGPAGLTAAIYAKRAGLDVVLLEKNSMGGGQMVSSNEIENYPGFETINGFELSMKMHNHVKNLDVSILTEEVISLKQIINPEEKIWQLNTSKQEILAKNVIYSVGANHKKLNVSGEAEFAGRGVSYCATCDGNFFRGKIVAVIGGGNTALQAALYLAKIATKVYLIIRRDAFRGFANIVDKVKSTENIEIIYNTNLGEIKGEKKVTSLLLINKNGNNSEINVDGVFISVGIQPQNNILPESVKLDDGGFVITDENCFTGIDGLYAVGDIRSKKYRQIVTAVADGAIAAEHIMENAK